MKLNFRLLLSLFVLSFIGFSCSDNNDNDKLENVSHLEETGTVKVLTASQIQTYYKQYLTIMNSNYNANLDVDAELAKVKYDVTFTPIKYTITDPFGKERTVSAMVGYPLLDDAAKKEMKLKVVSLQHGTLSSQDQAPSLNDFSTINPLRDMINLVAPSHEDGYVIVIPDYLGYGQDETGIHLYEHQKSLAKASRTAIDNLPTFLKTKNINISDEELYLFGYSEGGFATISTLKSYSENPSSFYKDIVTVAGAGAYDKVATAKAILKQTTGDSPRFAASYVWVLLTYNRVYALNRSLKEMFASSLEDEIGKYQDNNLIMQIQNLPSEPINVFNTTLADGLINETDKSILVAFADNVITNFTAKGTVDLVHGGMDTWVPPFNTDLLYESLESKNVTVNKHIFPLGDHTTTFPYFALQALKKL